MTNQKDNTLNLSMNCQLLIINKIQWQHKSPDLHSQVKDLK